MASDRHTPLAMAVFASIFALVLILGVGLGIAGSYALTLHTLHSAQTAQLAAAVQECKALRVLDQSHNGIIFPRIGPDHPSELALTRLFTGIHGVYVSSQCPAILSGHFKLPS